MNAEELESIIKGSIVGHMIGDALGHPYSYKRKVSPAAIDMIESSSGEPPGAYQAPASLSLCTMASINDLHDINPTDILEKFNDFVIAGYLGAEDYCTDISEITIRAVKNSTNGMPPDKCGISEDNDNEALARILPVALFNATDSIEVLVSNVHEVASITHRHIMSQVVCSIYCLLIRNILLQKTEKVFEPLLDYYRTIKMENHAEATMSLLNWKDDHSHTGSDTVEDCFWSSWQIFSSFSGDYRACVTEAVSLGNDANSCGAVTGSLAALNNGLSDIPTKWLDTIILSPEVMETVNTFTELVLNKITKNAVLPSSTTHG